MNINIHSRQVQRGDRFKRTSSNEQAILVAEDVVIHPEFVGILPEPAKATLRPLTSVGGVNTYRLFISGCTAYRFVEIVLACAKHDFGGLDRLIGEMRPPGEGSRPPATSVLD